MIKIFVTGGTFDKDYDEKNGKHHKKEKKLTVIDKIRQEIQGQVDDPRF